MYTNIDTQHAIQVITRWLDSLTLPEGFPLEMVKEVMARVTCNHIFEWGTVYFLQLHNHGYLRRLHVGHNIICSAQDGDPYPQLWYTLTLIPLRY